MNLQMKETMHTLHLILSILFFPWLLVWLWRALSNAQYNKQLTFFVMKQQLEEIKRMNDRRN